MLGAQGESGVNVTIVFPPDTASVPATSALPFGVYSVAYTLPLFTDCGLIGPLKVNTTGVVNVAIVAPYAGFTVTVGSVDVGVPFVLNVS